MLVSVIQNDKFKYFDHKISLDVQTEHWYQPNFNNVNAKVKLFQPKIMSLIMHFIFLDLLNQNSLEFHTERSVQHDC